MPFCPHCGAETLTGAAYCGSCGSAISISAAITAQGPAITDEPEPQKAVTITEASPAASTIQVPAAGCESRSPNAKYGRESGDRTECH
jgi:hypothetical protein